MLIPIQRVSRLPWISFRQKRGFLGLLDSYASHIWKRGFPAFFQLHFITKNSFDVHMNETINVIFNQQPDQLFSAKIDTNTGRTS